MKPRQSDARAKHVRANDIPSHDVSANNGRAKDVRADDARAKHVSAADVPKPNHTRGPAGGPVFPAPVPPIRSTRAAVVARWFGLTDRIAAASSTPQPPSRDSRPPLPRPNTITLITGPSGAGKSTLLRQLTRSRARRWIDVAAIEPPDVPLVDCLGESVSLLDVLRLLSRVGLGEAWTYLRTPSELSDGQRWRAKLAVALHRATCDTSSVPTVLVADEFAAILDRVTAAIVARALRRAVDNVPGLSAIVATSHNDLACALRPDTTITCDFDRRQVEESALR